MRWGPSVHINTDPIVTVNISWYLRNAGANNLNVQKRVMVYSQIIQ